MIDDQQIEVASESDDIRMPKFMQTALFPLDPDLRMLFLKALRSGNQRGQCPAVVPGDTAQRYRLHAGCSTSEETRMLLPLFAERLAPSITSIAATPKVAGD